MLKWQVRLAEASLEEIKQKTGICLIHGQGIQ